MDTIRKKLTELDDCPTTLAHQPHRVVMVNDTSDGVVVGTGTQSDYLGLTPADVPMFAGLELQGAVETDGPLYGEEYLPDPATNPGEYTTVFGTPGQFDKWAYLGPAYYVPLAATLLKFSWRKGSSSESLICPVATVPGVTYEVKWYYSHSSTSSRDVRIVVGGKFTPNIFTAGASSGYGTLRLMPTDDTGLKVNLYDLPAGVTLYLSISVKPLLDITRPIITVRDSAGSTSLELRTGPGREALYMGTGAGAVNITDDNIGIGTNALANVVKGGRIIAIGNNAGAVYADEEPAYIATDMILIGHDVKPSGGSAHSGEIVIGNGATGNGPDTVTIGGTDTTSVFLVGTARADAFVGDGSQLTGITPEQTSSAPASHAHASTDISDSTATGRSLLTATDAAAARGALGITDSTSKENRYDRSGTYAYCGTAASGSTESDSVWTISRLDVSTNPITKLSATNVAWADRLTATYA